MPPLYPQPNRFRPRKHFDSEAFDGNPFSRMRQFHNYLQERRDAFQSLESLSESIDEAAHFLVHVLQRGGKILACGNGGSAAEAQHLTTELIGRFKANRPSLPAVSLNADGSALTCIANDFGADVVFSRQIEGLARPEDALVVFSSSGNSSNILHALQSARSRNLDALALLGKDGGSCKGLAKREIIVPSAETAVVQEIHLLLLHYFCEFIEVAFA